MKKLKFFAAGLALVFAMCSAFTTTSTVKSRDQLYIYTGTAQNWNQQMLDQNPGNYQPAPQTYTCTSSDKICTYTFNGSEFVQNEKGTQQ